MAEILLDADRAAIELCTRSLWWFVREFWDTVSADELQENWHMEAICNEIQESDERVFAGLPKLYDTIINVPPGTSKTKIVSVLSTCWEFARRPSIAVFVGSYSDAAVSSIADDIKICMKSAKYQQYFPDTVIRAERDSLHNWKTTANGEFYAFTVGGTLTSKHADILKIDDPLNPKIAASEAELPKINAFFDKTLPTRKRNKKVTPTYLIMQRLHSNDPTGHLLAKKNKKVFHLCLPGKLSDSVTPEKYKAFYTDGLLDVNRLDESVLADLKIDLGEAEYSGQVQQNPVPEGGLVWQKWFIEIPDHQWPLAKWGSGLSTDWDLAYTKDDHNAASAYVTSFKYKTQIYLDDFNWQWLEFPQMVAWMKRTQGPHWIEAKASGLSARQTLSQNGVVANEYKIKGGRDKVARAKMASVVAQAGMVCIKKSMADRMYNDERQGILFFPSGHFKDLADALAQCIQRQSGGGVRVLQEETETVEGEYMADALEALDY